MNNSVRFISAIIFLFATCTPGYSQSPAYFVLGEKELANTDIYSINQGADERLFIATNHGLFEYRHGKFQLIPKAVEQQGNSLFNLTRDQQGDLFCSNIQDQIYKLVNGRLELFFKVKKELVGHTLSFSFDEKNNMIIGAKGCIKYSKGKEERILQSELVCTNRVHKLVDSRIVATNSLSDSILLFDHGEFRNYHPLSSNQSHDPSFIHGTVCLINGTFVIINMGGKINLLENKHLHNTVPARAKERYFQFSPHEIWALDQTRGVRTIRANDSALYVNETFFEDRFISAIAQGMNNTSFYGTFGQGLLVVPSRDALEHDLSTTKDGLRGIATDDRGNVFITQNGNGVIHYNGNVQIIHHDSKNPFHKIFLTPGFDYDLNQSFPSLLFDIDSVDGMASWLGAVKDVYQMDSSAVIIATSSGIFKMGDEKILDSTAWTPSIKPGFYKLSALNERCQSVVVDLQQSILYVAARSALFIINADNQTEELLFNGKHIICNDLEFYKGELWCATLDEGILVFQNQQLIQQYDNTYGLGDPFINKITLSKDRLFVSWGNGFQVLDLPSQEWSNLGMAEGIISGHVQDFALSNNQLWLLSDNTLVSIPLDSIPPTHPNLVLHLDSIVVSGKIMNGETKGFFPHDQNHFNCYVDFRSVEYLSQAAIHYRITGFENEWSSTPASTNLIEYKSLPPGDYIFEVNVRYGNLKSETILYPFQIGVPYWQTWWFYFLAAAGLGTIIALGFMYQIRRIRKINREKLEKQTMVADLLETELKALRSQMNPHFIFNSLNSIQDLILQQDTDASYDYIVLFAELVRNTLNYSNQEFIPVEKELDFLEIYLSLEKLRFKDEFSYEINYNGTKDIEVPSLIVQPFIENALLHGLLHKTGHKRLTVEFELKEQLICYVTDNGIGRKKSKEIQDRQGQRHESFALDAIKKRLTILTEQHGATVGYKINDLYDDGEPVGTKVEITMPYSNLY